MNWYILANILGSTFLSFTVAPFINWIGNYYKIVDIPNLRKVHRVPIVRIGGFSIFFIFLLFLSLYLFFFDINNNISIFSLYIILVGSSLYFLIGLHDDIFRSSPFLRLTFQFAIAFAVSNYGINFGSLNFFIPYYGNINIILPTFLDSILTSFWIVGITNAINWIDGLDGLAAGYCSILSIGLCLLMIINGNVIGIIFFSILFGSILGFLIRNFKPAYYIMGDCGSNFLGFCLSSSSLIFLKDLKLNSIDFFYLVLIFSLPIGDMLHVIFGRIIRGKNIFLPDKSHLHHKLMDLNFDYKKIISLMYFYSTLTILTGVFLLK